jgi:hypothetical protein
VGAGRAADGVQAPRPGGGALRSCDGQNRAITPWCRRAPTAASGSAPTAN